MKKMYNIYIGVNTMIYRIKEFRKKKKLTQEDLGNLTGISQPQIGRIESGICDMSLSQMEIIAKALDVEPFELLPKEWQPDTITPKERQLLDMIKKTVETSNTDSSDTAKAE